MRPTMHDVARVAGVSQKTVSNVLTGYPYIRESTRGRVMAAVAELGYQVNASARTLRTGRTGLVSLAVPDVQVAYFSEFAASVIEAAAERGWRVLIEQTGGQRERELDVLSGSGQRLVDGVILVPGAPGTDLSYLAEAGSAPPLVVVGESGFGESAAHVAMRHYEGARLAAEHLIVTGCRSLAAVGAHPHDSTGSAAERLRGWRDAIEAAGLPVDDRRIVPAGRWHLAEGAEAGQQLLASGVDVDGVFCFNDTLALGLLRVLLSSGRKVPDDVAVVGFDDVQEARYTTPSLTTVDPGRDEIARTALDMLAARLDGDDSTLTQAPPVRLVVRESTR